MTGATIQERTTRASRDLCAALDLVGVTPATMKVLTLALAEVAAKEIMRNPAFGQQIRSRYEELQPRKPTSKRASGKRPPSPGEQWKVKLTAVGQVDESLLDPYAPPNPFALRQLYGNDQLAVALGRYSLTALKQAVPAVEAANPGTKPKKVTKQGIIDYIVEHVAGP